MVDWSTLPKDLLALISKSLESSFDLIKFRSVCSSWRSAAEPKRPLPTHCLPLFPDYSGSRFAVGFCLLQWRILLIKPHESLREADQFGWLIKVQEDFNGSRKVTLLDLFRQFSDNIRGRSIPQHFSPYVLDMSKFKVRELGREVKLRHLSPSDVYADSFYLGKAVVKYLDSDSDADYKFVLLTINDFQKLAVFRSWDRAWTVIDDMPSHSGSHYHDVILFDGRFFAVDTNGRTVVVDYSSLKLKLAAGPVFGVCYEKYLIESCGEMLLVNIYSSMNERTTCRVFKYVEREKSWVEVYDLWDKMLFLGAGSNFSVSASDILSLSGGSSVFFHELDWDLLDRGFSVIDFSTGKRELVHKLPKYAKLFWPPPPWITSHERAPARSQYPNPPRMRLVNHSAARTRGGRVAAAGTRGGRVAAAGTRGGRVAAAGTRGGRVARRQWRI